MHDVTIHTVDVTNDNLRTIRYKVLYTVKEYAKHGWQLDSHMAVDWIIERGVLKKHILFTFHKG